MLGMRVFFFISMFFTINGLFILEIKATEEASDSEGTIVLDLNDLIQVGGSIDEKLKMFSYTFYNLKAFYVWCNDVSHIKVLDTGCKSEQLLDWKPMHKAVHVWYYLVNKIDFTYDFEEKSDKIGAITSIGPLQQEDEDGNLHFGFKHFYMPKGGDDWIPICAVDYFKILDIFKVPVE